MSSDKTICPVLIVDDDDDLCHVLEAIMKKTFAVHVEHTLKNAETYLNVTGPTVVLLDNNLPDGLGVESIKGMLAGHPDIRIVLMTADTTEGIRNRAIREGAVRFVQKPFRTSDIKDIVLSVCSDFMAA